MNEDLTSHIIINLAISALIALSFMGFMHKFNKKEYFMSGTYLSALVAFCTLLVMFIIKIKNN